MKTSSRNSYRETFTIRASEVSPEGRATLPSICYLLQEVAGNNALELNFDISQLKEKNLTWILHRLHLKMDTFPKWRDAITIETWPTGGNRLRAYRDFRIINNYGDEIGRCLSYWLMLDLDTRRPVRIPNEVLAMAPDQSEHVLAVKQDRLNPSLVSADNSIMFDVRRSDLDMNRHVNNVKYIEWALAVLKEPEAVHEIDIEFRAECGMGSTLNSMTAASDNQENIHLLQRADDEDIVAVAITS